MSALLRPSLAPPPVSTADVSDGQAHRPRRWVTLLALAMLVSSDYKLRVRALADSVSGRPDLQILLEIGAYLVVSAFLLMVLVRVPARRTAATPLLFVTLLYCVYMAASAAWALYPALAIVRGWQFLVSAALVTVIARSARRVEFHHFAHWFVALVGASVVSGLLIALPGTPLQEGRFSWLYVHPVVAGAYCGLALVLLVWLVWLERSGEALIAWPLWVYGLLFLLVTGGLLGTQTRGAIGAALPALVLLVVLAARGRRVEAIALLSVGGVASALLFLRPALGFLSRGQPAEQIESFNGRFALWGEAWRLFVDSPLIGYGLTGSRGLFVEATGLGGAHNAFVNVVTDGGAIGAVLWLSLLGGLVALLVLLRRLPVWRDAVGIGAALFYLALNGLTYEGLGYVALMPATVLFVLVGWVAVLVREATERAATHAAPILATTRMTPRPGRQRSDARVLD